MLTNASSLKGLSVQATDGELGTVEQFFFDDETWAIRYLVVNTGGWLSGREVLISPAAIVHTDWPGQRVHVALTRKQVEESPGIDIHMPISRRHEAEYMGYYGYPYYWGGPGLWGSALYPAGMELQPAVPPGEIVVRSGNESADSHLRSSEAVRGYSLEARDGEIGHLEGFLLDDLSWAIRYLEVATRNWWPGKRVLVSPGWIERMSWMESKVFVGLSRATIQSCPEYQESMHIDREYEDRVYVHYGRLPYWIHEAIQKSSAGTIGA
jgi:hypothetical protein